MRDQDRVVITGGGIASCSALYHLTQEGWTDVMLMERDELTSATTWHSAAQVTNFSYAFVEPEFAALDTELTVDIWAIPNPQM